MNKYRLNKATWNPEKPWDASWTGVDGRRHRKFFATKGEAERWVKDQNAEAKAFGSAAISDELRIEALRADEMLGGRASVLEAVRYYVDRTNIAAKSVQFHELLGQVLLYTHTQVSKGERSWEHLAGIRKVGKRMDEVFGSRIVCEIEKHEIIKWLESLTHLLATSKDFYRRYATSIFAFACTRQYCQSNPCHGITNSHSRSEIEILLPHEVEALLTHCHISMVPFYAIGCFAGLRPMSELLRLTWDKVYWDDRVIDVENVKTRGHANSARNRFVQISDNLSKWLRHAVWSYPDPLSIVSGKVVPGNWRDFIYGRGSIESDRKKAGITRWPHDCMRHSFASYHLALHQSADKTADQMGHAGSQLIFSNYRRKVTPKQAEEFWSIVPK